MDFLKIVLIFYGINIIESQLSIPGDLKECYLNNNMQDFHLPMNIRVLLDIIRKVEKYSYAVMDMKAMSSSILHRFKFDGIEYYENVQAKDGILPFGQSGKQSIKCKLIKEIVPGKPEIFPFDVLTAIERCTLHQAISNTIMTGTAYGGNTLCREIGQKLIGRTTSADSWNCPREYGVILTPHGTIAPGAIIGAIAASLQYQNIELDKIIKISERPNITDMDNIEQVDFIIPRDEMIHEKSMSYLSSLDLILKLDNVWLTTIAGDLAEMVVYQGPIVGPNMQLGETGFWNNTMRPNVYFLNNKYGHFDATRAEIISDIDGLIIANKLQTWMDDFYSLRLSQVLDMYYSNEGITLFNENIKVCDRKKMFSHIVPKTLLDEQTYAASHVLAYFNSITYTSLTVLKQMVDYAVTEFSIYANDYLLTELLCRHEKYHPQIETLIVFDGSWSKEYTTNFIAALIDDLDVSMYGSKMGIIHGTSGQWLLNVTNSPSLAYYSVSVLKNISWPTHLNFITTLNTIYNYFNETWETRSQQHIIGSLGQVVIILAPLTKLTETDQDTVLKLLRQIKHHHPDLNFLYYVSKHNSDLFNQFILSEQDHLVLGPNIDAIAQSVATVPRILRPADMPNPLNESSEFKDEVEDYINPSKSITYILNPQHIVNIKKMIITVHNFGYGTIKVCSWNHFKIHGNEEFVKCQHVDAHKYVNVINDFKCINAQCPYIHLRIQNATSFNKCAEIECRSPDQVRYIIRMQSMYYGNSANKEIFLNICIFYLFSQLVIFIL